METQFTFTLLQLIILIGSTGTITIILYLLFKKALKADFIITNEKYLLICIIKDHGDDEWDVVCKNIRTKKYQICKEVLFVTPPCPGKVYKAGPDEKHSYYTVSPFLGTNGVIQIPCTSLKLLEK